MFRTEKESATLALKELYERGEELLGFNVFEVQEAKKAADAWYQELLFTLEAHVTDPSEVIRGMNKELEKEEVVLYTGAIRSVILPLTGEMEKEKERLESKLTEVLRVFRTFLNQL